jgi:hypothetical protein
MGQHYQFVKNHRTLDNERRLIDGAGLGGGQGGGARGGGRRGIHGDGKEGFVGFGAGAVDQLTNTSPSPLPPCQPSKLYF